jgi:Bacterial regulatory proteins, luxR family
VPGCGRSGLGPNWVGSACAGGGRANRLRAAIAELAAVGRTSREIAAQLFMSSKTVEANLAVVCRSLRFRSRVDLGAAIGSG